MLVVADGVVDGDVLGVVDAEGVELDGVVDGEPEFEDVADGLPLPPSPLNSHQASATTSTRTSRRSTRRSQ